MITVKLYFIYLILGYAKSYKYLVVPNSTKMIHYEMPKELRSFVLLFQAKMKIETGNGKYSQQQTITRIIKEYKKIIEDKK